MNDLVHAVIQWPLSVNLAIILILSIVVPVLSVLLIRHIWPYPTFRENNELIGFTYAVYGVIYGVLLAFTIIIGWEGYTAAEQLVMDETTILSELWRDSEPFPPAIRESIHKDLNAYAQSVVDDEWPAMAESGKASPQTQALYEHLWSLTYDIHPETENQKAYLDEFLVRMNELSGDRRLRILHSTEEVPSILMLVLLIGGVVTVAYTLLFSNKHAWVQVVIMGNIMLLVMLGLLVTLSLQHPFSGGVSIQPEAFEDLLDSFSLRMAVPAL
jgi:hypothetical protein